MDASNDRPDRVDVLEYTAPDGGTVHRFIETGRGSEVVEAHRNENRKRTLAQYAVPLAVLPAVYGYALLTVPLPTLGLQHPVLVGTLALTAATYALLVAFVLPPLSDESPFVPTVVERNLPRERAASLFPDHE